MFVEGYTLGVFASNTYLVAEGDAAVVIDPGQDAPEVVAERVEALGLRLEAVLLTHGHVDHVWTAKEICDRAGVPAYLHPGDQYLLDDVGAALGALGISGFQIETPGDVLPIADEEILRFGELSLTVRHTPGHTPGSCVFLAGDVVFSGDLIFQGSIGRTDFPKGSFEQLMESLRRAILPLDDAVTILSGHGPQTTVGTERRTNPFVVADGHPERLRLLGL